MYCENSVRGREGESCLIQEAFSLWGCVWILALGMAFCDAEDLPMAEPVLGAEIPDENLYWEEGFIANGANNEVNAAVVDSSGTLYIAGKFSCVGDQLANRVAKWDGTSWSPLGEGLNDTVDALALDAEGNLYAGGEFSEAGGLPALHIAKWDGSSWSAMGVGLSDRAYSIAIDPGNGEIYAGGEFIRSPDDRSCKYVARWNGRGWDEIGGGMDDTVHALTVDGSGNLYVGGKFGKAGDVTVTFLAQWNGSDWSAVGGGPNSWVWSLTCDGKGNLYAGGTFKNAGGVSASNIAKWDGAAWSALGSGINGPVYSTCHDKEGNIYAGGYFSMDIGVNAENIIMWNGSAWSALGSGMDDEVWALACDSSNNLYAGGEFSTAGDAAANNIAKWNGNSWSSLAEGVPLPVTSLARDRLGNLFAGCMGLSWDVTTPGPYLYMWDGAAWSVYDSSIDNYVMALHFDRNTLMAGGTFSQAGCKISCFFAEKQPRVNLSQLLLGSSPGPVTIGNDAFGFYKPALLTTAQTTVSFPGDLPTTVTIDQADEIHLFGRRIEGAFSLAPSGLHFAGQGALSSPEIG